jgi:hypothetical protein
MPEHWRLEGHASTLLYDLYALAPAVREPIHIGCSLENQTTCTNVPAKGGSICSPTSEQVAAPLMHEATSVCGLELLVYAALSY